MSPYLPPLRCGMDNTMASVSTVPQRKRVRTGCLNCRRKHKKCDELKPTCNACITKGESCEWPVPKLKKSSRRSSTSSSSSTMPMIIPAPYNTAFPEKRSLDLSTYSLQPEINNSLDSWNYSPRNYQMTTTLPMKLNLDPLRHKFTQQDYLKLDELVGQMESVLSKKSPLIPSPELSITTEDEMKWMSDYLTKLAPSLDTKSEFFSQEVSRLCTTSTTVKFAIYCLSSFEQSSQHSLKLFQMALYHWCNSPYDPLVHDTTILLLSLFLFHHDAHSRIYPYFLSSHSQIQQHMTLLRLTIQPNLIITDDVLLSLLSFHQNNFISTFQKTQDLIQQSQRDIILCFKSSPFPQVLLSSQKALFNYLILNMGMVILLLNKPMDIRLRSHPVSHFAKQCCGLIQSNLSHAPWFMNWCLYTVGKVLTHELEHECVMRLMYDDNWKVKLRDYWEGRGDV